VNPEKWHLKDVVSLLCEHSQRATYGAVGGLVGLPARSVMFGQPKTPTNSFVVSKKKAATQLATRSPSATQLSSPVPWLFRLLQRLQLGCTRTGSQAHMSHYWPVPNYSFKRTAATGCATIMRYAAAAA
jgi:hypothetical protein